MTSTVKRRPRVVSTTPDINNFINDFFNTAVGDVIQKADKKYFTNPAVNVREHVEKIELEIAIPGVQKDLVTITVDDDLLKIESTTPNEDSSAFRLREFNYAGFSKNFKLPETIDTNSVEANFDSGILTLTLGKKKEAIPQPPRKISIQ